MQSNGELDSEVEQCVGGRHVSSDTHGGVRSTQCGGGVQCAMGLGCAMKSVNSVQPGTIGRERDRGLACLVQADRHFLGRMPTIGGSAK